MKRISRKRALILARKYERIADELRIDNEPGFVNRRQAPDIARSAVANAQRHLTAAVCLLNDYANGRV